MINVWDPQSNFQVQFSGLHRRALSSCRIGIQFGTFMSLNLVGLTHMIIILTPNNYLGDWSIDHCPIYIYNLQEKKSDKQKLCIFGQVLTFIIYLLSLFIYFCIKNMMIFLHISTKSVYAQLDLPLIFLIVKWLKFY